MPLEVVPTPYGRPALQVLQRAVAGAKRGDALAPVTVIVPANHVGVTARRALAEGSLGPMTGGRAGDVRGDGGDGGIGVAAVMFLTVYRLAELIGAARLAAEGRRPVSTPVLAAALRRALREDAGLFAPVAQHPATESALVAAFGELSDVSPAGLDALTRAGPRARDVVRLCRRARAILQGDWYDEADLTEAAIISVQDDPSRVARQLGQVVVHLPQDLLQRQARLVAAVAEACPATVVAGVTGVDGADAGVRRSLGRLGAELPDSGGSGSPDAAGAADAEAAAPSAPARPSGTTHILTASDADDEVRAAVRVVVDAARAGTPLERIAILFGAREPYGRLVHEHLAAAGIPRNGAAVRPLAGSLAGRTLLDLLALPDHDYRRADVVGLLSRARGRRVPAAEWQRLTRQAGVVAGHDQWSQRLERLATELDRRTAGIEAAGTDPFDETGAERRREAAERVRRRAQRVRDLAGVVVGLIDDITEGAAEPRPWWARVQWLRRLAGRLLGGDDRADWPTDEQRAADRVESALDRLASLDGIDDPPSLDVFRRTLELELDADLGRVGRFGEGVMVGPLSFAVGLDLDVVIVLGMAEGTLPAVVHDDSLLPDGERRKADGELPLRRERVAREHRRLLAALASADRHLLCAPRGDLRVSSERILSRWLADLAEPVDDRTADGVADGVDGPTDDVAEHVPSFAHAVTHTDFPATEQEYRLREGATLGGRPGRLDTSDPVVDAGSRVIRARRSRDFTRFDGNLAGVAVPSPLDEVVSSTRLESWASCPFAYFVNHLLQVDPVEDPARQLTISAWDRGSLVHEILQSFVDDVLARPPEHRPGPDQPWSPDDRARMRQLAEQVCDDYEARGLTGRPVFWRRERAQILALADRFLGEDDKHRRRARSRPVAAELRFGYGDDKPASVDTEAGGAGGPVGAVALRLPDGRSVRFRGAADRVDVTDAGTIQVVDYKTGKSDDFRRLSAEHPDERGTKLQLPVYGLAARQFVGRPEAPVEAHYWFVSDREAFKRVGYAIDDHVLARVGETLATVVDGIERGAFPARPDASGTPWVTCPYCDPDGLGVADLRRNWERKRHHPAIAAYAELAEP
jgi:RecB family exonuclease